MNRLQSMLTRASRRPENEPRTWCKDGDIESMLRVLDDPPFRFRISATRLEKAENTLPSKGLAIARYIQRHKGATVRDIGSGVATAEGLNAADVRSHMAELYRRGALRVVGRVPLEQLDPRYERVATCAVCGAPSSSNRTLFWKYGTPVVRCSGCKLLYANPRWNAEHLFGRYTPEYWDHYAGEISETALDEEANYNRWINYLAAMEASRLSNRILDVGCATGEFLLAAKRRNWELHGVETSPPAAKRAAQLTGGQVHNGTFTTVDYPAGHFDVVTMWDVIEHLQDPRSYVEQANKLLRPGGLLSITTPNIRSLAYALLGPAWTPVGPNDHIYYFAPRTLVRLLDECGFSVYVMHTSAAEYATWHQWLPSKLQRLAPYLRRASLPITNQLLLGDELYVVAQKRAESQVVAAK